MREALRILFTPLRRLSILPTIWSNLLAGWCLACIGPFIGPGPIHEPDPTRLMLVMLLGGTFLYIGEMCLNDDCGSVFDPRSCQMRSGPVGKKSQRLVGFMAVLWFIAGIRCFLLLGPITIGNALLLITVFVVYHFHRKNVVWTPILMSICRCLLYLLAFCAFREFFFFRIDNGEWWRDLNYMNNDFWYGPGSILRFFPEALSLGLYAAGIASLAWGESRTRQSIQWAVALLLSPIIFACGVLCANPNLAYNPQLIPPVVLLCLLQLSWLAWLLIPFWQKPLSSPDRVVSGLFAGMVFVDLIALVPFYGLFDICFFFLPLFLFALVLQRVVPSAPDDTRVEDCAAIAPGDRTH